MSLFERNFSLWVALAIASGVVLGSLFPASTLCLAPL